MLKFAALWGGIFFFRFFFSSTLSWVLLVTRLLILIQGLCQDVKGFRTGVADHGRGDSFKVGNGTGGSSKGLIHECGDLSSSNGDPLFMGSFVAMEVFSQMVILQQGI